MHSFAGKDFKIMPGVSAKYSQFVMPDHINVVGTLFGGQMIAWVDLAAAKVAHRFLKGADVDGAVTRTIIRWNSKNRFIWEIG